MFGAVVVMTAVVAAGVVVDVVSAGHSLVDGFVEYWWLSLYCYEYCCCCLFCGT